MSTLPEAVRRAVRAELEEVHTVLPARVETYDRTRARVSVKPLLRRTYADGQKVSLPVVTDVPVIFPRAGEASLTFPLNRGDTGLLLCAERSLEEWLSVGGEATPADPRRFELTDAIFLPGLYPFNAASPAEEADALVLKNAAIKLKLRDDKAALGTEAAELLDLVSQALQALSVATVATMLGPQPLSNAATYASLKNQLDSIKGTI